MELHRYANGDFFNKLPEELRKVIIPTTVVSGHGRSNRNSNRSDGNWESLDKIYLLNTTEIWSDFLGRDTGYNKTRQLDYYKNLEVRTGVNYSVAIKKNINGDASYWWLRAADSDKDSGFLAVSSPGYPGTGGAGASYWFSPAFRIG